MARLSEEAWRLDLANYPRAVEIRARYGDVDSFRHLNNVALSRFFEEGRASLNMEMFGVDTLIRPADGFLLLFASTTIEYIAQGEYPGMVTAATAVHGIGRSSFRHAAALFQNGRCIALSDATTVHAFEGKGAPIPQEMRATLARFAPATGGGV